MGMFSHFNKIGKTNKYTVKFDVSQRNNKTGAIINPSSFILKYPKTVKQISTINKDYISAFISTLPAPTTPNCSNMLTKISKLNAFNLSSMADGFYEPYRLSLTQWTSDIYAPFCKTIDSLFMYTSIPELNISIDTNSCIAFNKTFESTTGRKFKYLQSMTTKNGTNFENLFKDCKYLSSIPYLNLSSGLKFANAFYHCNILTGLPEQTFNELTGNIHIQTKSNCFTGCRTMYEQNYNQWKWFKDHEFLTDNWIPNTAEDKPLTFTAVNANTTVKLTAVSNPGNTNFLYSLNSIDWMPYTLNQTITLSNIGDTVMFKNTTNALSIDAKRYYKFVVNGLVDLSGNCNSLINFDNTLSNYIYYKLFENCNMRNSKDLILPSKTLKSHCYDSMFLNSTNLISAPILQATAMASYCYANMFKGCTNLSEITTYFTSWYDNTFTENWLLNTAENGTFICPVALPVEFGPNRIPVDSEHQWTVNHFIDENTPLTFEALKTNTTVGLYKEGSPDPINLLSSTNGTDWNSCALDTDIILTNIGDKVMFKCTTETLSNLNNYYYFKTNTGLADIYSNCNSLINFTKDLNETKHQYVFYRLFNNCNIINTKDLLLPASTLADSCYSSMFNGCTSLSSAPELPATTLADSCYVGMFYGCTSLSSAPELPATTLAGSCYGGMFDGCTSLSSAPELPATTLANGCYYYMFDGCTSLSSVKVHFITWNIGRNLLLDTKCIRNR